MFLMQLISTILVCVNVVLYLNYVKANSCSQGLKECRKIYLKKLYSLHNLLCVL